MVHRSGHGRTWRTSGSGIYQGGTILNYTFNAGMQDLDTLVIATVPIHTRTATPQATPDAALLRPPPPPPGNSLYANNPMASSPFVATKGAAGTLHVASGALHCSITYEVALASNPPEVYQAMAFFGMAFDASGTLLACCTFPTVCVCMCWIVEQGSHICLAFCAVPMEMCGVEVCPQGDCAAATMQAATTFSKLAVTTGTWAGGRCMSIDVLTSQVPSCNLRHIHSGWWPSDASGWLQCLLHPATTHSRRVLHDPNGNRPVRDHCVARQQQRGTHQPCRDIPHVSRAASIGF